MEATQINRYPKKAREHNVENVAIITKMNAINVNKLGFIYLSSLRFGEAEKIRTRT